MIFGVPTALIGVPKIGFGIAETVIGIAKLLFGTAKSKIGMAKLAFMPVGIVVSGKEKRGIITKLSVSGIGN